MKPPSKNSFSIIYYKSPLCVLVWLLRASFVLKEYVQNSHLKGLSVEWVLWLNHCYELIEVS